MSVTFFEFEGLTKDLCDKVVKTILYSDFYIQIPEMSTAEKIALELADLPPSDQAEVLDFVEFIKKRKQMREEKDFKNWSLDSAMRGMEDEPDLYELKDIKESIK